MKPSLDLFLAEVESARETISFHGRQIFVRLKRLLEAFELNTCECCASSSGFAVLTAVAAIFVVVAVAADAADAAAVVVFVCGGAVAKFAVVSL